MVTRCVSVVAIVVLGGSCLAESGRQEPLSPLAPALHGFDFGPSKEPTWPGFVPVTPGDAYSQQTGFGWDKPAGHFYSKDYERYDPLTLDCCRPQQGDATFSRDLPNGHYLVTVVFGDLSQFPVL